MEQVQIVPPAAIDETPLPTAGPAPDDQIASPPVAELISEDKIDGKVAQIPEEEKAAQDKE